MKRAQSQQLEAPATSWDCRSAQENTTPYLRVIPRTSLGSDFLPGNIKGLDPRISKLFWVKKLFEFTVFYYSKERVHDKKECYSVDNDYVATMVKDGKEKISFSKLSKFTDIISCENT